jgi:hypothetical protein
MEPEGSLPHSQVPTTCPFLSQIDPVYAPRHIIIIIIIIIMEAVPGKHSIDSLQKTAVLGTAHIIRKALQCEA